MAPKKKLEVECLRAHNKYRANHNSPPLKLDQHLCNYAAEWARYLAKRHQCGYRPNNCYGENVCIFKDRRKIHGREPVDAWYSLEGEYNYVYPYWNEDAHHFTQIVWKDSRRMGMGTARVDGDIYIVCNYDPPGNDPNQLCANVSPPKKKLCDLID